jgi:membrane protease YdiL (CAAX protease family)
MRCPTLSGIRKQRWFAWQPDIDTVIAVLTAIVWIGAYYLLMHLPGGTAASIYDSAALLLVVLFPVWWLCRHRGRPLAELGITARKWKESILISIIVAIPFFWLILTQYAALYGDALIPHFLTNALVLWEPFFVFCWLELRFGRAFGIIPGIILAGICFGAYHLGTYPLTGVVTLVLYGIAFGAIFRLTDNLLSMWPLAWAASSSKGTLAGGMLFSWYDAGIFFTIVVVQLGFIAWTRRRERE